MPTAICVLRSGGEYRREHVDELCLGLAAGRWPARVDLRLVCLTDQPEVFSPRPYGLELRPLARGWPGWWAKLELFAPEHDDLGDLLYFDLDTMFFGDLTDVVRVGRATLLQDFYQPQYLASGMMYLTQAMRAETWTRWMLDPNHVMRQFDRDQPRATRPFPYGDGGFLDSMWRDRVNTWQETLPDQVASYKLHCRFNVIPPNARVVCFHGYPRPWQTRLWRGAR